MKKTIALVLAALMVAALFVGCGSKKAPLEGSAKDILQKVIDKKTPEVMMADFIPVDVKDESEQGKWQVKNFTGLESAEKLADVSAYESMTGSVAFSLVMVRVKDQADAKAVAEEIKAKIDPRKWICVGADDMKIAGYADTIMLVMMQSDMGMNSQEFVDAFKSICPADLDFTI